MKRAKTTAVIVVLALALALGALVAWKIVKRGAERTAPSIADIHAERGVPVRVETPVRTNLVDFLALDGTVAPNETATVMAQIDARVLRVHVEEGDEVFAGESPTLLVELERDRLQANLAAAQSAFEDAKVTLARVNALLEQGAASQQDVDRAAVAFKLAQAQFVAMEQDLAHTRIHAPIGGIVAHKLVDPGMVTSKGMPLIVLVDVSRLRMDMQVPESRIQAVAKGMPCRLVFDAYPDAPALDAEIASVNPAVDPASRMLKATCYLQHPPFKLVPGMHGTVQVVRNSREDVLAVGRAAVIDVDGAPAVFVVDTGETAKRRFVELGIETDGIVEVRAGLTGNEQVVVDGHKQIADGTKVSVVQ
ncbi:MAG: efflux RND transporter periplasmic adaptor subunit [Kiritimatiellae bacterium]|nr:efflux RND transporter periplasmic adaptor subunit [Kiritimatiellia bacterium]